MLTHIINKTIIDHRIGLWSPGIISPNTHGQEICSAREFSDIAKGTKSEVILNLLLLFFIMLIVLMI